MAFTLPFTRLPDIEVFAVDAHSVQVAWRNQPSGRLTAVCAGVETLLGDAGRPGVAEIDGIAAASVHPIDFHVDDRHVERITAQTSSELPGDLVTKVATISDMHLGEQAFGLTHTIRDRPDNTVSYPLRCTLAAVDEALRWGAEMIVFKGDITHAALPGHWELFNHVLDQIDVPVMAVPGNHDVVHGKDAVDHRSALRTLGLSSAHVQVHDLGTVRVVAVDTTIPGKGSGTLHGRLDQLLSAVDTDRQVLVLAHHHFEHVPVRYFWPPGVRSNESTEVLRALADANSDIVFSSGHTHRCRSRNVAGLLVTEVGSVKDHPGVWAGYEVHEGGIRQTVRRVAEPSCVDWTERTSKAVGGIWGRWSSGSINQRSVSHTWPRGSRQPAPPATMPATR